MNRHEGRLYAFGLMLGLLLLVGCAAPPTPTPILPTATAVPPTATAIPPTATSLPTATPIPPTATSVPTATPVPPTATPTVTPTSTPLPGNVVIPIENMVPSIPWLSQEKFTVPTVRYLGFNVTQPPFDNVLVRQAFAAAIDHQRISDLAVSNGTRTARPASSFTPPEVLGRDLSGQVGIQFDPTRARALLAKAGYPNGQGFPTVNLAMNKAGTNDQTANAVAAMLRDNLNVGVNVQLVEGFGVFLSSLNRGDAPGMHILGWAADFNDPDNLVRVYHSRSSDNYSHFADRQYDLMVEQAAKVTDPASRQVLYIQIERYLLEEKTVTVPLYYYTTR